jgi:hypothetical protein
MSKKLFKFNLLPAYAAALVPISFSSINICCL